MSADHTRQQVDSLSASLASCRLESVDWTPNLDILRRFPDPPEWQSFSGSDGFYRLVNHVVLIVFQEMRGDPKQHRWYISIGSNSDVIIKAAQDEEFKPEVTSRIRSLGFTCSMKVIMGVRNNEPDVDIKIDVEAHPPLCMYRVANSR